MALARRGVGGRGWRAGGPMAVARRGGGAAGTRSLERTWHDAPSVVCWVWHVDCVCFPYDGPARRTISVKWFRFIRFERILGMKTRRCTHRTPIAITARNESPRVRGARACAPCFGPAAARCRSVAPGEKRPPSPSHEVMRKTRGAGQPKHRQFSKSVRTHYKGHAEPS